MQKRGGVMRIILCLFLVLFITTDIFSSENTVYIKDGKIMVETDEVTKALDYNEDDRYVQYNVAKWEVKEMADPVQEALNIYKKKGEDIYTRRIFIVDKASGGKNIYVEYISKKDDRLIFSPNEDFVYYIGLSPSGVSMAYGLNLVTNKTFILDEAESLNLAKCQDERSYVVVNKDGDNETYYIYELGGKMVNSLNYTGSNADISKMVCK